METAVLVTIFLITVLRQSCVAEPEGAWTDTVNACIRGNNNWQGYASSIVACQEKCEAQSDFRCLSVDYKPGSGTCVNSRYNRNSVPPVDDFTQPCYVTGWQYSERRDLDFPWTETVEACIRLNNHGEHTVSSMEECQLLCEGETSFPCLSVDFRGEQCLLSRYNRESIRPLNDYTQPCYIDGYQYAERVDKKYFWTDTVFACIRGNNDERHKNIGSLEDCKHLCIEETSFTCLSIDYFPDSDDKECLLSSFNRYSVEPSGDFTQPCYTRPNDGLYAERVNVGQWIPIIEDSCITGFNEWTGDVEDFESCKILCSQRSNCCSVDYNRNTKRCLLTSETRATVSSTSFISPCSGFSYAERIDVRCVT